MYRNDVLEYRNTALLCRHEKMQLICMQYRACEVLRWSCGERRGYRLKEKSQIFDNYEGFSDMGNIPLVIGYITGDADGIREARSP